MGLWRFSGPTLAQPDQCSSVFFGSQSATNRTVWSRHRGAGGHQGQGLSQVALVRAVVRGHPGGAGSQGGELGARHFLQLAHQLPEKPLELPWSHWYTQSWLWAISRVPTTGRDTESQVSPRSSPQPAELLLRQLAGRTQQALWILPLGLCHLSQNFEGAPQVTAP